jgi:hypothetical protein
MSQVPSDPGGSDVPRMRRSVWTWIILLVVWGLGLISWTVYIAAVIYVLVRII